MVLATETSDTAADNCSELLTFSVVFNEPDVVVSVEPYLEEQPGDGHQTCEVEPSFDSLLVESNAVNNDSRSQGAVPQEISTCVVPSSTNSDSSSFRLEQGTESKQTVEDAFDSFEEPFEHCIEPVRDSAVELPEDVQDPTLSYAFEEDPWRHIDRGRLLCFQEAVANSSNPAQNVPLWIYKTLSPELLRALQHRVGVCSVGELAALPDEQPHVFTILRESFPQLPQYIETAKRLSIWLQRASADPMHFDSRSQDNECQLNASCEHMSSNASIHDLFTPVDLKNSSNILKTLERSPISGHEKQSADAESATLTSFSNKGQHDANGGDSLSSKLSCQGQSILQAYRLKELLLDAPHFTGMCADAIPIDNLIHLPKEQQILLRSETYVTTIGDLARFPFVCTSQFLTLLASQPLLINAVFHCAVIDYLCLEGRCEVQENEPSLTCLFCMKSVTCGEYIEHLNHHLHTNEFSTQAVWTNADKDPDHVQPRHSQTTENEAVERLDINDLVNVELLSTPVLSAEDISLQSFQLPELLREILYSSTGVLSVGDLARLPSTDNETFEHVKVLYPGVEVFVDRALLLENYFAQQQSSTRLQSVMGLPDCHRQQTGGTSGGVHQPFWVYHYLPPCIKHHIIEDGGMKTPLELFNEYIALAPWDRAHHAWTRIFSLYCSAHVTLITPARYSSIAKRWTRKKAITDADVFGYLCWRSAINDIGVWDATAGARTVYFTWTPMPEEVSFAMLPVHSRPISSGSRLS